MISDFRLEVYEDCAVMGYYAASSANFLPTLRNNLSVPTSMINKPIGLNFKDQ